MAQPTANEQYFLELVNRARANPSEEAAGKGISLNQGLASGTISASAKQPLVFNEKLMDSSLAHSKWMLDTDNFSHTGVGGSDPGDRIEAAGYQGSTWGENISIRWGSGTGLDQKTMDSFHDGLFKSAGHRENILNGTFKEVGIGVAAGEYQGSQGADATQNFGKNGNAPFLTGVAFGDKDGDQFYDVGEGLGGITVKAESSTGAVYQTKAYDTGGYQMAVQTGTYKVTFSGAGLGDPVTKTVTVGSNNVKVDAVDTDGSGTTSPAPKPAPSPEPAPKPEPTPEPSPQPNPEPTPDHGPSPDHVQTGGPRGDHLAGTNQSDTLSGKGGSDVLYGRGGDDILLGGRGNDYLKGGTGDDVMVGGKGADVLNGGSGADSFVFTSLKDGGDRIVNFSVDQGDTVDISSVIGHPDLTGQQMVDQGFLKMADAGHGVSLLVDADGGGDHFGHLATLGGTSMASLGYDFVV